MHRLSVAQLTIDPVAAPDLITVAAEAGFDAVGLRLQAPAGFGPNAQKTLAPSEMAEARRRLRETGLFVLDATALWLSPEARVPDFAPALDRAAELGARFFLVAVTDTDRMRALDNFRLTCELAAVRGVKIALEFMAYAAVNTLADACGFLTQVAHGNAGLVIDALHLIRSGGSAAELARVDAGMIAFAQLCDAPLAPPPPEQLRAEAVTRRLYPGLGELPLADILDALPDDVLIDIEAPFPGDAGSSAMDKAMHAAAATRAVLAARHGRRRAG